MRLLVGFHLIVTLLRLVTVGVGTWAERNGRIIFAASTIVWDVQVGQPATKRASGTPIFAVAWSPDGARLATATQDQKTIISEVATGKEMVTLNGHADPVLTVAWSPDGKRLLTGSADKTARIRDARTGRELQTLTGQSSEVVGVIWNPSGYRGSQLSSMLTRFTCAKSALSFSRSSSARLRSSMSVEIPYHLRIFPYSSRSGTARDRNQRY